MASVEFCNSLNVMLSNLSRMSKSSWPTVNHPTYDLNALLNSTTLAHGISISLRVRVDKRNFDTWLDVDENGITLIEGEITDVILFENQSTGYEWIYDTSDSNDIYTVDNF